MDIKELSNNAVEIELINSVITLKEARNAFYNSLSNDQRKLFSDYSCAKVKLSLLSKEYDERLKNKECQI